MKAVIYTKEFVCQMCGNTFESSANRASYCPDCRKIRQRQRSKTYNEKISNCEKTRTIGEPEICPECGNTYILKSGSQKVCPDCRKKHNNRMKSKSNAKYTAKTYDMCVFYVKKGRKQELKDFSSKHDMSFNELVNQAVNFYMQHLTSESDEYVNALD